MKLALTPTRCSNYEYPIYFIKQLDDNWLRAIDKLTQEVMLVKRRDNMKLALTPTRCSNYEYPIYFIKQLDDNWLRAIDKLTQEVMLVKRVLVTSNWRKTLENFLFLQPRPFILLPYAVVYDRKGFMYYIMQDRDIKGAVACDM
ncbi:UNVERIFIED_CONTAM: hypothetical protein FKN15_046109 [Acipenser sinensis]